MLRPKQSSIEPNQNGSRPPLEEFPNGNSYPDEEGTGSVDIQQELNRIEEIVLSSPRIPLTKRTLVDEEKLLEQLDFVRLSLPGVFQEAATIVQQKEEILLQAEEYGQKIVDTAEARKAQILDQSEIIKQAQREAEQLRRQVQQECEAMMQETLAEIDNNRRACMQELEEMRLRAIAEAEQIEQGADDYADSVLLSIEQQLKDMLRIVSNGRQQLYPDNSQPVKKKK